MLFLEVFYIKVHVSGPKSHLNSKSQKALNVLVHDLKRSSYVNINSIHKMLTNVETRYLTALPSSKYLYTLHFEIYKCVCDLCFVCVLASLCECMCMTTLVNTINVLLTICSAFVDEICVCVCFSQIVIVVTVNAIGKG